MKARKFSGLEFSEYPPLSMSSEACLIARVKRAGQGFFPETVRSYIQKNDRKMLGCEGESVYIVVTGTKDRICDFV